MENEAQKPQEDKILHWENIIKGWIMSLIGLIIFIADVGHLLSWWILPSIPGVEMKYQIAVSIIVSLLLFAAPDTVITKFKSLFTAFTPKS